MTRFIKRFQTALKNKLDEFVPISTPTQNTEPQKD